MLETIRIQNFKSLRDVTLDLKQINLLIGPNNSGKSNFLKALIFLNAVVHNKKYLNKIEQPFNINIFRLSPSDKSVKEFFNYNYGTDSKKRKITFNTKIKNPETNKKLHSKIEIEDLDIGQGEYPISIFAGYPTQTNIAPIKSINFDDFETLNSDFETYTFTGKSLNKNKLEEKQTFFKDLFENNNRINHYDFFIKKENENITLGHSSTAGLLISDFLYPFQNFLENHIFLELKIYKIDPINLVKSHPLNSDEFINDDASNIVSFLDRMKDINIEVINAINKDLSECIQEFKDIRLDTIKQSDPQYQSLKKLYNRDTFKKFGVSDHKGNIFWAEELSEGALYFIALLAIIHQPNPPKLLLLEEPEKGIHPRRIAEIIRYIQKLAHDKNIQVIITSHSPLVLDEFANDPESIFVFDKEDGETIIRNLQRDIIDTNNKKLEDIGEEPIDYTSELSKNWLMGLLNGVPND